MSFSSTIAGATVECARPVSATAEGVSASVGAVCSLTGALTASAEAVCSLTGAVSASAEAAAASAGAIFCVFG